MCLNDAAAMPFQCCLATADQKVPGVVLGLNMCWRAMRCWSKVLLCFVQSWALLCPFPHQLWKLLPSCLHKAAPRFSCVLDSRLLLLKVLPCCEQSCCFPLNCLT